MPCVSKLCSATRKAALPSRLDGGRLKRPVAKLVVRCTADDRAGSSTGPSSNTSTSTTSTSVDKELDKFTRQTAATFAPRASGAVKNPAVKGSMLYNVFEYQAWVALLVGGLLSFNLIFPTEQPSIPRLMGMWSIWMFTIPSLRAKECMPKEKEALNYLFLLVPLINVTLPLIWKSFPVIFCADVAALLGMYAYKGVWEEVYGLPLGGGAAAAGMAAGEERAEQGADGGRAP